MTQARSLPAISFWRSTTFARVLQASTLFILAGIAALWSIGWVVLWQIDEEEWGALEDLEAELTAIVDDGGPDALIDAIALEDGPVWDPDQIYAPLEEGDAVVALWSDTGDILAGYPGLDAEAERAMVWLDHDDIDDRLRAYGVEMGEDGQWLVIARFETENEAYILWLLSNGTLGLLMVGLPLSLVIGFFLSRSVFRRIETISDTAMQVATGAMDTRAAVSSRQDEFDRVSNSINEMLDKLQVLNQNIESVTVGVAHDLKTPLANIGGRLELMRRDIQDAAATDGHITAAEGYLSDVLRIFDALLRLGEVETGRRRAAFAQINLSEIVDGMAEAYAAVFDDAQKSLTVRVQPDMHIHGDRELLEQMLSNLLENALEHSRDAARATISLTQKGGAPVLTVGDDGPGIAPPDRARVFDRFYRADQSRTTPGSGLGLALVKAIADLHGARVRLDDTAPGAVFVIEFPKEAATLTGADGSPNA
ncbi:MAG: HAMP domain-containing sensor histidine kinase [Pseudomonadota bacterium]